MIKNEKYIYFSIKNPNDFENMSDILKNNGFTVKKEIFLDTFYDTLDLNLLKSNQWLLSRDGKWILKSLKSRHEFGESFLIYEGQELILRELKKKYEQYTHFPNKTTIELCFEKIKEICPRKIASIATSRFLFSHKTKKLTICIDTFKTEDGFYSSGYIKFPYNPSEKDINNKIYSPNQYSIKRKILSDKRYINKKQRLGSK